MGYIIGIAWTVSRRLEHGGNGYLTSNKCAFNQQSMCIYWDYSHVIYIYIWDIYAPDGNFKRDKSWLVTGMGDTIFKDKPDLCWSSSRQACETLQALFERNGQICLFCMKHYAEAGSESIVSVTSSRRLCGRCTKRSTMSQSHHVFYFPAVHGLGNI